MRPLAPLILLVLAPVASAQEKTLFIEPFSEKLADRPSREDETV